MGVEVEYGNSSDSDTNSLSDNESDFDITDITFNKDGIETNNELESEIDSIINNNDVDEKLIEDEEEREKQELINLSRSNVLLKKDKKTKVVKKENKFTFNKKKEIQNNLQILFKKFNIIFNAKEKKYEVMESNVINKEIKKISTIFSLSKISIINNYKNILLIITDNTDSEFIANKFIISKLSDKNNGVILINVSPYLLFQKLFFEINSDVINFTLLQLLLVIIFISEKIILFNKFNIINYIFYKLLNLLNLSEKIEFVKHNSNLEEDIEKNNHTLKIKEEYKNFTINESVLIDFIKNDKLPSDYKEQIISEFLKLINFKVQIKNESFDGLTKIILSEIKKKNITEFTFNTFVEKFIKEYQMIPEKELLKHYLYIISNFDKNSQISLFDYSNNITKNKKVNVNKKCFDKLLQFNLIVKKKYNNFWICLIPVQLFYGKDFYALNMKKIFNNFIDIYNKNGSHTLMSDNNDSLYLNIQKEGIVENTKTSHKLELYGIEKNILKYHDPRKTRDEFLIDLLNNDVKFKINNKNIIIENVDKAKKYLKFSTDKNNLIFDFSNISYIGKTIDKNETQYKVLLKYYNKFQRFNIKIFKHYLLNIICQKIKDKDKKNKILEILKLEMEDKDNNYSQISYMLNHEIDSKIIKYESDFFNDFKYEEIEIENIDMIISDYIKSHLNSLYKKYF